MRLNYESRGSGPNLIILHGLFGSLDNWRTMSRRLSDHFRVFSVDLRNHGSSPHCDEFDYESMAADIRKFMHEHSLRASHLPGHSMGGKAAMQCALSYPDMVDALIVVDIAPRSYPGGHEDILKQLSSLRPERLSGRKEAEGELSRRIADQSVRSFLLKNLVSSPTGGLRWKMNLETINREYGNILKGIAETRVFDKPVLFIRGGESRYVVDDDFQLIRKMFPSARFATLPGAGHWVHADTPDLFEKNVREFLGGS